MPLGIFTGGLTYRSGGFDGGAREPLFVIAAIAVGDDVSAPLVVKREMVPLGCHNNPESIGGAAATPKESKS